MASSTRDNPLNQEAYIRPRPASQQEPEQGFWGTIQNYVTVRTETGVTDATWVFLPDDGGKPTRFARRDLSDDAYELRLGDGTRCVWDGECLKVKMPPELVRRAEELFARINSLPAVERAFQHASDGGLIAHTGWAWDENHILRKAIPPPSSRASPGAKRYPCAQCGRPIMKVEGRRCSRCRASPPAAPDSALSAQLAGDDKLRKMVELMLDDAATTAEAQAALAHARRRTARPDSA